MRMDDPPIHEIDDALRDFGFYHRPIEVQRMYSQLQNHGNLGYPGAVLDQPEEYWRDMATMNWLRLWVKIVKPAQRLTQNSVFNTIKTTGKMNGVFTNGNR